MTTKRPKGFDRKRALRSIVTIGVDDRKGMGFLAGDEFIITAAHCFADLKGLSALHYRPLPVLVSGFASRKAAQLHLRFYEPCSDLAILALQSTTFFEPELPEAVHDAWEELRDSLESAPTYQDKPSLGVRFGVNIHTHKEEWLAGSACIDDSKATSFCVTLDHPDNRIECGTSGAPVFDDQGRAVGIVSTGGESDHKVEAIRLGTSLPGWMLEKELGGLASQDNGRATPPA